MTVKFSPCDLCRKSHYHFSKISNLTRHFISRLSLFQLKPSEGFKMAVQHHLDQPLMQINEIDISPGFETQVGRVETIYYLLF